MADFPQEIPMVKGMPHNNKMLKKPKKGSSLPPLRNTSSESTRTL